MSTEETRSGMHDERLAHVLTAAAAVVYTAEARGRRLRPTWVSGNIERIFGYTTAQALAEGWWWENVHPEDRPDEDVTWTNLEQTGRHEHRYRFRHADGTYRWVHEQLAVDPDAKDGQPTVIGSWMDITSSKVQEERLIESEERFRQLVTHIPQVFWMVDLREQELIYLSPSYEKVWGRPADDLAGVRRAWLAALHPDERALADVHLDRDPGEEYDARYRVIRPDGAVRWISDRGFPIRDEHGVVYRQAGIAEDITERVRATERLAAAEAHYRRLITTSPYAVYTVDANGVFTELNPAAERLLGSPATTLLGRHFNDIVAPDHRAEVSGFFEQMIEGDRSELTMEVPIVRTDGGRRLIVVSATVIRGDKGFDGAHGIARDITEEREQHHRTRMLAEALDRLPDAVSIEREDGSIMYANTAYRELVEGAEPHVASGLQTLLEADTTPEQRAQVRDELDATGSWRGRTVRTRAGQQVPLEIVARRLELDNHQVTILLARDVTQQAAREMQLRRAERLASIGTLIGGVAHELNNPLTAIAGFIELMLADGRSDDDREALETMRREAARVGKIVSDLRLLARKSQEVHPRNRQPIDLNDIIRHVVKVRRYALETGNVEVHFELAHSLPPALGVPSEIEQVVLNLVVNASHALEGSVRPHKRLTLRTGTMRTGVAFEVIDNGTGIPEHAVERIFDPFFTTKSPGEGTGLGLSLVHSIISEHDGRISVNSIEGRGSTFSVWLPLAGSAPESVALPSAAGPSPDHLRVLVVDDEPAIRLALVRHLQRRGHEVQAVGDGAEALELITERPYDVIVSDIRMPGMSGDVLLHRLLDRGAIEAVRRLLFMTGDPASEAAHRALDGLEVPIVAKPFTLAEITQVIEARAAVSEGEGTR